jgi:hypothetical protein
MGRKDPRVDAYIAKSAEFARPILKHLRSLVHRTCPDVVETMKWNFPHFDYKGMFCGMAAFKNHCVFGFWKDALIVGRDAGSVREGMGSLGRLTDLSDLPGDRILVRYIRKAVELNDAGVKAPTRVRSAKPKPLEIPAYFKAAVTKSPKARKTFDSFSLSNKREYVEWVVEAKTGETRARRLATAIEWMSEGKIRNWKYVTK